MVVLWGLGDTEVSTGRIHIDLVWVKITPTSRTMQLIVQEPEVAVEKMHIWFKAQKADDYAKISPAAGVEDESFTHLIPNYSQTPTGFYKVEAELDTGEILWSSEYDVYAQYIPYDEVLLLRGMFNAFTGPGNIPVMVYPRRTFGTKCDCAPPGQGSYSAQCMKCLGVGFVGGYHKPVLAFVDFRNIDVKDRDHGKQIINESTSNVIHMSAGYTIPKTYDIVRELNAPMPAYLIQNVQFAKHNSRPLDCFCTVKQVDSGNPIYKIDMPRLTYVSRWGHYVKRLPDGTRTTFRDEYDKMVAGLQG